jgi:UDP-glucose 4-epimerase
VLGYLRRGGQSRTFNCGYGKGASVVEVIDSVRRVSGREFPVEICGRRPGDPAALVASVERIRSALDRPKVSGPRHHCCSRLRMGTATFPTDAKPWNLMVGEPV